jgi:hypothetical protein
VKKMEQHMVDTLILLQGSDMRIAGRSASGLQRYSLADAALDDDRAALDAYAKLTDSFVEAEVEQDPEDTENEKRRAARDNHLYRFLQRKIMHCACSFQIKDAKRLGRVSEITDGVLSHYKECQKEDTRIPELRQSQLRVKFAELHQGMKARSPFSTMLFYRAKADGTQTFPHQEKVREPLEQVLYVFYDPPRGPPSRDLDLVLRTIERACVAYNESVTTRTKRRADGMADESMEQTPGRDLKRLRSSADDSQMESPEPAMTLLRRHSSTVMVEEVPPTEEAAR